MKKLLPLLVVFVVSGIVRAEEVLISSGTYSSSITTTTTNAQIEWLHIGSDGRLAELYARGEWNIGYTPNGTPILKIDPDGDIFIRGKWVAWSGLLAKEMKAYYDSMDEWHGWKNSQ